MMPPNKPEGNSKEKMKQMRLPFAPIQKENSISKQKEQQEKERERVALEKEKQKQLEAERAAKEEKLTEPRYEKPMLGRIFLEKGTLRGVKIFNLVAISSYYLRNLFYHLL
jgi:hypothetical protein